MMIITSVPIFALCESGPLDETPGTTVGPAYYKVDFASVYISIKKRGLNCILQGRHDDADDYNDDRCNVIIMITMAKLKIMTMLLMIWRDIKTFVKKYRNFPHQAHYKFFNKSHRSNGAPSSTFPLKQVGLTT